MSLPGFQEFMLPSLRVFSDGTPHTNSEVTQQAIGALALSEEDLAERIPTGSRTKAADRVLWSLTYLTQAGLLQSVGRGSRVITARGLEVLAGKPARIDIPFLRRFPEFQAFQARARESSRDAVVQTPNEQLVSTPAEALEEAFHEVQSPVRAELIAAILENSPAFFERLVLHVLTSAGYGGEVTEGVAHLGKAGDGGVDGVIREDALGLELIYVQAKRYAVDQSVGRPAVQQFAGSLEGLRAKKGVFITTSSFTEEAKAFVRNIEKRIALVDGQTLVDLMLKHGIGCRTVKTYEVKAIDQDYFEE